MAQWKSKEDYEKWKAERISTAKEASHLVAPSKQEEVKTEQPVPHKEPPPLTEKKCPHCAMIIPREAKICPHCRKRLGTSTAAKIVLTFIIIMSLLLWIGYSRNTGDDHQAISSSKNYIVSKNLPQFKIVGYITSGLILLVPPDTLNDQLKALINEFRSARENNSLPILIPPTTKGGSAGDYGIVWIFVFSDEQWASRNNILSYINSSSKTPVDREVVNHIRAEYYYAVSGTEYGNLGCRDEKDISPYYEYLF